MSISEYEIADVLEHDESSKNQNEQKNNIVHIINLNHNSVTCTIYKTKLKASLISSRPNVNKINLT